MKAYDPNSTRMNPRGGEQSFRPRSVHNKVLKKELGPTINRNIYLAKKQKLNEGV